MYPSHLCQARTSCTRIKWVNMVYRGRRQSVTMSGLNSYRNSYRNSASALKAAYFNLFDILHILICLVTPQSQAPRSPSAET